MQAWKYVRSIGLSGTTAPATCVGHGFADGDVVEVKGADSLCPYYNGLFTIRNVTANSFAYTVSPGTNLLTPEPLTIVWPIRNEGRTDIWCRRPQKIELTGLATGVYHVEAIRKSSMAVWQDENAPTLSRPWTVASAVVAPRFESISSSEGNVLLSFMAQARQSYSVLGSDSISGPWQKIQDIAPLPASSPVSVTNPMSGAGRFFRLVSPAQP